MVKISNLPALSALADGDYLAIVDASGNLTAKISRADLFTMLALPDDVVTADNIDFTTFGNRTGTLSSGTANSTTYATVATIDTTSLPSGKYVLFAILTDNVNGASGESDFQLRLVVNGVSVKTSFITTTATSWLWLVSMLTTINYTAGQSIVLQVNRPSGTKNHAYSGGEYLLLKVG